MGKLSKAQQLRENTAANVKTLKQATLSNLPKSPHKSPQENLTPRKEIVITSVETQTKEEELDLKVSFRLHPSKLAYSKVLADLYFDGQRLDSLLLKIFQSPLITDDLEFNSVFGMRGISAGIHAIKVEMYELWSNSEKLSTVAKEITVNYVPVRREDRLVRIPTVKSVVGADLRIISSIHQDVYREIEQDSKRDLLSKRDEW